MILAAASALAAWAVVGTAHASVSVLESRCESRIARVAIKLSRAHFKLSATCRDRRAAGETLTCPGAKAEAAIAELKAQLIEAATARCGSICSISQSVT